MPNNPAAAKSWATHRTRWRLAGAVPPQPAFIHAKEDYHGGLRLHALDDRQRLHQQLVKDGVRSLLL
eukprot:2000437-Prymnesium_polylepis.1